MDSFTDMGTLPPWEKGTHQPSQTTSGYLRDGHKLSQLHTVKPDLWDPSLLFEPTQGCQKVLPFSGTLDGLVGSPKLQFIWHVPIHTEVLWSLPL